LANEKVMPVIGPGIPNGPGNRYRINEKIRNTKVTIKRFIKYLGDQKKTMMFTFLLCLITTIVSIIGTRMNGESVDNFIIKGDMAGLYNICLILTAMYLASAVTTYFQNRFMVSIAQRTSSDIRRDLYRSLQMLPLKYFDTHSSGDLMSRLTNDVDNINMTLSQSITQFFSGVINIAGMLIAMVLLSPVLTLVGLTTTPFMYLLTKFIVKRTQPFFIKQQKELGVLNGYIEERISGQKAITLFGQEEQVKKDFEKINKKLTKSAIFAQAFSGIGPVNNAINNLTYLIITVCGAYFILAGMDLTIGMVFTFLLYMRNFTRPINELMNIFNSIQSALAGVERVFEVMDEPKEKDSERAKKVSNL